MIKVNNRLRNESVVKRIMNWFDRRSIEKQLPPDTVLDISYLQHGPSFSQSPMPSFYNKRGLLQVFMTDTDEAIVTLTKNQPLKEIRISKDRKKRYLLVNREVLCNHMSKYSCEGHELSLCNNALQEIFDTVPLQFWVKLVTI